MCKFHHLVMHKNSKRTAKSLGWTLFFLGECKIITFTLMWLPLRDELYNEEKNLVLFVLFHSDFDFGKTGSELSLILQKWAEDVLDFHVKHHKVNFAKSSSMEIIYFLHIGLLRGQFILQCIPSWFQTVFPSCAVFVSTCHEHPNRI